MMRRVTCLAAVCLMSACGAAWAVESSAKNAMSEWKTKYPLQYYSAMGSADHIDDLADPNFGYGHASQAKFMMKSIANANKKDGNNATCFSCKTVRFNDIYKRYGDEALSGKKSVKYSAMVSAEDFWSCTTCHADMTNPAASVGRQIITPALFGRELFDKFSGKTAACAQCHNNLAPWSDSRIIIAKDALKAGKTAYRYGWDPEGLIKATLEDAMPKGVRYPEGKTYEMSAAAGARTDETLGIYLIANGNHADAEFFMDSVHYKQGLGCADCHMPVNEDRDGTRFHSHDSSKSVLNSKAAMQMCLTCHTSDKVKNIRDMVAYVRSAQKRMGDIDRQVEARLSETFDLLKSAIEKKTVSAAVIEKAKFGYAKASFYKEFCYGNRGATPGEKVAHNPVMGPKYLNEALAILDETQRLLKP